VKVNGHAIAHGKVDSTSVNTVDKSRVTHSLIDTHSLLTVKRESTNSYAYPTSKRVNRTSLVEGLWLCYHL
jgi:hypothetical protein